MKSFKEIANEYQEEIFEGAKLKKAKKWIPDEKGNLKKVLKKICADSDGNKAPGYKLVGGKKCERMSGAEIKDKKKSSKKAQKTKNKNAIRNTKKAEKILKKKITKGLVQAPENQNEN